MLRQFLRFSASVLLAAGVVATAPVATAQQEEPAPAPIVRDGSTPEQAAASCWAIKQEFPDLPNGEYWLLTPTMAAPEQFYCEQEMDGGGWVMVGKGREGWEQYPAGKGDPARLLTGTRTPADFDPTQLSEKTINGLLAGGDMRDLPNGIRVVRALNSTGSSWQRLDLKPTRMSEFSWALASEDSLRFRYNNGGAWYSASRMDRNFGFGYVNDYIDLSALSSRDYKMGFALGSWKSGGSTSPSNFLWTTGRGGPLPYSEVFLRPEISNDDPRFAPIDDAGTEAHEQRALASSFASPTTWGVTGNLNGRWAEGNAPVQTFAEIGDTMFVGGNFTTVEQRSTGTRIPRTAVAAFDKTTGGFKEAFNVNLDGQVKALLAMPNGKLLIGGEFRTANSQRHVGTVLVDPVTGEVDESWNLEITTKLSSGLISIRSLSRTDEHVYIGGAFTHMYKGDQAWVYARGAGRVNFDGLPDRSWNPEFNGNVVDIDNSAGGDRFYAAGYFTQTQGLPSNKAAVLSTEPGAQRVLPDFNYVGSYSRNEENFQQTVTDTGNLVFFGGAQHSLMGFEPTGMQRVSGSITKQIGGDFQASDSDGDVVYAGCHCSDLAYQDAYYWQTMNTDWSEADKIQWFGAWDAVTGKQIDEFSPYMLNSSNAGAWGLFVASDGAVWAGGDFTGSRTSMDRAQWNGGFVRYPARDSVAPATPINVRTGSTGEGFVMSWDAVADADYYEILRDDRVIATTTSTNITVNFGGENRFFVRAADNAGNRSASTSVFDADIPADDAPATAMMIGFGDEWNYSYNQGTPAADWNTTTADYTGWQRGATPIGYGGADLGTTIITPVASARPVTTWFTKRFDVADPSTFTELTLNYIADDGSVVYLNGQEIHRTRMDDGLITPDTRANAVINANNAKAQPASVTIPSHMLEEGANTLAVETHLNYLSSPSMTFDAELLITNFDPAPEYIPEPEPITVLDDTTVWHYRFDQEAPQPGWKDLGNEDTTTWDEGTGTIGWGHSTVTTELTAAPAARPQATYFAHDFDVDKSQFYRDGDVTHDTLRLQVRVDDGAVVYLNGEEIARQRMDEGDVTHDTYANAAINTTAAMAEPLILEIPLADLHDGTNRLAIQTHLNYRSTPNMTFNVQGQILPGTNPIDEEPFLEDLPDEPTPAETEETVELLEQPEVIVEGIILDQLEEESLN